MHSSRHILLVAVVFALLGVSQVALAQNSLGFIPVSPCRITDTRWPAGLFGGPSIQGRSSRSFPVPQQTTCNIPASAAAYSLNVTLIPPPGQAVGFVSIWPTGQLQPNVSTVNSWDGRFKATAAIVPAGTGGAVSVYASDTANIVLDINGYFEPVRGSTMAFYPLNPCRVADTRGPNGDLGGPYLLAAQMRRLAILESSCGIQSSAEAYSFNFTAIPKVGPLWVFNAWPDGLSQPNTSTLNAPTGTVVANAAIVPAGPGGAIDVWASNDSDLAIDVNGYFAPAGPGGLSLYNVPPCRVLDTRNVGSGTPFTGALSPPVNVVASGCGASSSAQAFVLNSTIVPAPGPVWLLTLWPDGEVMPGVSTLNAYDASVTSNMAIVPTDNGSIDAYAAGLTQLILDVSSYFASPANLSIKTTSLPAGELNISYSTTMAATGGVQPYTWSITSGALPGGLNLDPSTGVISGTPMATGSYSFTIQVADSGVPQATARAELGITINQYLPLSVTTTSLPSGTDGSAYNATVNASGGATPYTWSISNGALPSGLDLNSSTGVISGIPNTIGKSNFTVQVTDSQSPPAAAAAQLSIAINSGGDPGALSGNYAFVLSSFDSTGQRTLAGSFVSDGHGNITSGVVDGNSVAGQPFNTAITGTYSIGSSGLNTFTIQGQSYGPVTIAFVLSSSGNGRIIRYDDATGQGARGSGILRKQDSTAFLLGKLSGGYAFGMTGADASALRMVDVGVFTLTSGNVANGACVINEGGTFQTCTFSGSLAPINAQTGRGVSTIIGTFGTSHQAVYVVSRSELIMEQIDSVPVTHTPLLIGSVLQQSGSFSNASLNGTTVLYYQDIHAAEGADQSGAMNITFDGNGNGNIVTADEDLAGVITQKSGGQMTYTVAPNGAAAFGGGGGVPVGFLVGRNHGFFVGTGSNSIFAVLEPQSGGPFSNASIVGTYAGGSLAPLDYANGSNEVDVGPANGLGTLTLSGDSSQSWGLDQWIDKAITYSIASNGRGTGEGQGDHTPAVIYVISPTKFVVLMPQRDAELAVFEH